MAKSKQEMDDIIKNMKNAPCSYPGCGREQFMSCSLPYGFFTESGELSFPLEYKEGGGASLIVPLCAYHFPFAGRGILAMTDQGMIFPNLNGFTDAETGEPEKVEDYTDKEIEEMIKELQKKSRIDRKNKEMFLGWVNIFQAIQEGRKFEKEMAK